MKKIKIKNLQLFYMKIILKVLKIFFVLENMLRSIFRKIIILLNIMFSGVWEYLQLWDLIWLSGLAYVYIVAPRWLGCLWGEAISLRIYKDYGILHLAIPSDSFRNAIKFYLYNFLESIPCIWAHQNICFTTIRQTETTRRTARKFLTNL